MTEYKTGDRVVVNNKLATIVGKKDQRCFKVREDEWGPDVEPAVVHKDWLSPVSASENKQ